MASNMQPSLLQCTTCHEELNLESQTLSCLHSFCRSCLDMHFEGETNGKCWCPECHEPVTLDQLSLSPFLVKSLRRRQLESTNWKCDLCLEDGIESIASNWCRNCQKLYCTNCHRIHKKLQKEFHRKHNMRDLDGMERDERDEVVKTLMTDMCSLHNKAKDMYCEQCNVCLCDKCYQKHSADSPGCSSAPLSVRVEALKQKSQGPILAKEMDDFELSLRKLNANTGNYAEELHLDCESKCWQLWEDFNEMMENAKRQTNELCEEMRQITEEQVKKWHQLLEENENILKQLEIWRMNLHHLLNESEQDVDVVCGLRSLRSKLSSRLDQNSIRLNKKCQLSVKSPNWWRKGLKQLKNKNYGSVSLSVEEMPGSVSLSVEKLPGLVSSSLGELPAAQNLVFDKQFNVHGSDFDILSICVSKEDDHIFICDHTNHSIIELTEKGEFFCECKLFEEAFLGVNYQPLDICLISPDILFVACSVYYKLIILERRKIPPLLRVKEFINTEKKYRSLCKINESILASDMYFQIDSLSKEGKKIKTLKTGDSVGYGLPRMRSDPRTRNFWWTDRGVSEIFCFNSNGKKLHSVKTEEQIIDFCVNEFGHLYYCNKEGIFSFSPEKNLWKFEEKSAYTPRIFILGNKMFVAVWIKGKWLIKIFRMF